MVSIVFENWYVLALWQGQKEDDHRIHVEVGDGAQGRYKFSSDDASFLQWPLFTPLNIVLAGKPYNFVDRQTGESRIGFSIKSGRYTENGKGK